jgi:hypothetical protein
MPDTIIPRAHQPAVKRTHRRHQLPMKVYLQPLPLRLPQWRKDMHN